MVEGSSSSLARARPSFRTTRASIRSQQVTAALSPTLIGLPTPVSSTTQEFPVSRGVHDKNAAPPSTQDCPPPRERRTTRNSRPCAGSPAEATANSAQHHKRARNTIRPATAGLERDVQELVGFRDGGTARALRGTAVEHAAVEPQARSPAVVQLPAVEQVRVESQQPSEPAAPAPRSPRNLAQESLNRSTEQSLDTRTPSRTPDLDVAPPDSADIEGFADSVLDQDGRLVYKTMRHCLASVLPDTIDVHDLYHANNALSFVTLEPPFCKRPERRTGVPSHPVLGHVLLYALDETTKQVHMLLMDHKNEKCMYHHSGPARKTCARLLERVHDWTGQQMSMVTKPVSPLL